MNKDHVSIPILEGITEYHPNVFLLLNHEHRILRASKTAQIVFGYSANELYSMKLEDLWISETAGTLAGSFWGRFQQKNGQVVRLAVNIGQFWIEANSYTMVIAYEISHTSNAESVCTIKRALSFGCRTELYRRYEAIAAGIIVYDTTGRIVFSNRNLERILNCPGDAMQEKFLRSSDWKFVDGEGNQVYVDDFPSSRSLIGKRPVSNKILGVVRNSAGYVQWLLMNSMPLFEPQTQELAEIIVTITDITVLRNAAQALRKNERRLIFAMESIHAGEWELNIPDLRVRYSSRSAEIFLGKEHFEGFDTDWSKALDCFVAEDREKIDRSVREAIERRQSFDITGRILRADGTQRWIQASGRLHEEDGAANLGGIVVDITEQKLAEMAQRQTLLHSHETVFKEFVESFGLLHFVVDSDLRYAAFNKLQADLMSSLFGVEISLGQKYLDFIDVIAQKAQMERNLRRALSGEVFSFTYYFTIEGQGLKCLITTYCPIRDLDGVILGVSVFGYDPEKSKAAQAYWQGNEYRYRKLVEDTNLILLQLNAQGEILHLNRFGCEFFEYTLPELVGEKFDVALAPVIASSRCDTKKFFPYILRRKFYKNRRRTSELVTRSQKRVWVEWSCHWEAEPDQSGPVLIAAGMDVTRVTQIRMEERQNSRRHRRQEILNEAIGGMLQPEEFDRLARIYRISLDYPLVCLVLQPEEADTQNDGSAMAEKKRQLDLLTDWLETCGASLVWQTEDGICLILASPGEGCQNLGGWGREKAEKIAQQTAHFSAGLTWRCGVSWAADRSVSLSETYFRARTAVIFGPAILGSRTVYSWRDLGSYQLLARDMMGKNTECFIEEQLGPLLDLENKESQSELFRTLRELASFDSDEKIAQRLNIHRMTVRYRKAALAKLLSCDLNSASVVNNLAIAVLLWELRNKCDNPGLSGLMNERK